MKDKFLKQLRRIALKHFFSLYIKRLDCSDNLVPHRPVTRRALGGAKTPLENFSPPLEKCSGHRLKLLDIVQKVWAPFRKLFVPPDDPSWLRAW